MIKVMTILGTRPEIIKMSRVIDIFDKFTNHILVHTGQNHDYELNEIFFKDLAIRKPNYLLNTADSTACKTIANILVQTEEVIIKEKPDAVMLYGDTNSCLSVITAKKYKIPIFHMEAGNRCFDHNVPEELNRKIIDHISDINIVLTEHARRYLIAEGFPQERIIKVGSHLQEVYDFYMAKINQSDILKTLQVNAKKYFLASLHREENVDIKENLLKILEALKILSSEYDLPILVSTHPRTHRRMQEFSIDTKHLNKVHFIKPLGFLDYVKLQINALCTLSDSGSITEEAALLNFPAVTIRNTHERPEGMDAGVLIMTGLDSATSIVESVNITIKQFDSKQINGDKIISDYNQGRVSGKILNIVQSYVAYINRKVWFK